MVPFSFVFQQCCLLCILQKQLLCVVSVFDSLDILMVGEKEKVRLHRIKNRIIIKSTEVEGQL